MFILKIFEGLAGIVLLAYIANEIYLYFKPSHRAWPRDGHGPTYWSNKNRPNDF